MRAAIVVVSMVLALSVGCKKTESGSEANKPAAPAGGKETPQSGNEAGKSGVLRLSVLSNGDVLADGRKVTPDELAASLSRIKAAKGEVWCYHDPKLQKAPAVTRQIMGFVVENHLALTMSTKPDFSDCVGSDGKTPPK
jgi:hypothetical protein